MDVGQIIAIAFAFLGFIVLPLIAIVGHIMVELAKAKRSGVDVEGIIRDLRRHAFERGRRDA